VKIETQNELYFNFFIIKRKDTNMNFKKFVFCILFCSSLFCSETKKNYIIDFVKKNRLFITSGCVVFFLFAYSVLKNYGKAGKSPVNNEVGEASKDNEKEVQDNEKGPNFVQWLEEAKEVFKKYDQNKFVLANPRKKFYKCVEWAAGYYNEKKDKKMRNFDFFIYTASNNQSEFEEDFSLHKDFIKDVQVCVRCKLFEGSSFMRPLEPHKKFLCSDCIGVDVCPVCPGSLSFVEKDGKKIIACDEAEEVKEENIKYEYNYMNNTHNNPNNPKKTIFVDIN